MTSNYLLHTAAAALVVMLLIAGCSTIDVYSIQEETVDFQSYQDFAMLKTPAQGQNADPRINPITMRYIQNTIRETLTHKGFTEAPQEEADFLVSTHANTEGELDVIPYGGYYPGYWGPYGYYPGYWGPYGYYPGYWGGWWDGYAVREYTKGIFVIDIMDAGTKELVWRGWAETRISDLPDREQIREAVEKILARFPPQS